MPKRKTNKVDKQSKNKKSKLTNEGSDEDSVEDLLPNNDNEDNDEDNDDDNEEEEKDQKLTTEKLSAKGNKYNFKIISWNVNGLRACLKKNGFNALKEENADIICLQETKCKDKDVPEELKKWSKYPFKYWSTGDTSGYAGVCLLSKTEPIEVMHGIGIEEHDSEGRVITAEYEKIYLVTAYVPNSGRGLKKLDYRMKWDRDFTEFLNRLKDKKPVVLCGDLNVAHQEIDLENPKTNTKTAGFTREERDNFTKLLDNRFIDSFRQLYPKTQKQYTFWSYLRNARQKNIGWRLDYFVISQDINDNLCDNQIRANVMGSDHCPIVLFIAL